MNQIDEETFPTLCNFCFRKLFLISFRAFFHTTGFPQQKNNICDALIGETSSEQRNSHLAVSSKSAKTSKRHVFSRRLFP